MSKRSVRIVSWLSILSFAVLLVGFGWTIQSQFFSKEKANGIQKEKPVEEEEGFSKGMTIVALGDSLTRGTGDPEGKGYIGYLVDQLQEKSKEKILVQNLGVKGYRSNQLLTEVRKETIQRSLKSADVILITIGGNDLFQGGQTMMDLNMEKVDSLKQDYLKNLKEIMNEIRKGNKDATVYFVGLYNPFIDLDEAKLTTKVVRDWNYTSSELLDGYPNTVFVPTFDLFQLKVNDYLYTDKFHPNTEGYKLIAERIASLITW